MMLHRLRSFGWIAMLVASLVAPQAATAAEGSPSFSIQYSNNTPKVGEEVQVTVQGHGMTDVYAFEVNLAYDKDKLEYKTNSGRAAFAGFSVPESSDPAAGRLQFAHTKMGKVSGEQGDVTLVTLTFKAAKEGTAWVSVKNSLIADSQVPPRGTNIASDTTASITIAPSSQNGGGNNGGGNNGGGNNGGGNNGGGNNGGNNNGSGGSSGSSGSSDTDDTRLKVIRSEQFSSSGSTIIHLEKHPEEVRLPSNTAELLQKKPLELRTELMTISIPAALFEQLMQLIPEAERKNSTPSLKLKALSEADSAELLKQAKQNESADIQPVSRIIELALSIATSDGKTKQLTELSEPIAVKLKTSGEFDPRLAGLFLIGGQGEIEYIGGQLGSREWEASIQQFGQYGVLELQKPFQDVPNGHWAYQVIRELAAKQIVDGVGDQRFEPSRIVTRAEFTSLLVRALQLPEGNTNGFDDVKPDDWYADAVERAVHAGIVQGKEAGLFAPHAAITREEAVTMLIRAYTYAGGQGPSGNKAVFEDEAMISPWALFGVLQAAELGLVQGRSAGSFEPRGITTRAEAAQIIHNLLGRLP
jgi:large repetitive protein